MDPTRESGLSFCANLWAGETSLSCQGHWRSWDRLCDSTNLGSEAASVTYEIYDFEKIP